MALLGIYKSNLKKRSIGSKKLMILSAVFISIAGLMIFQDYMESLRQGGSFYFSESFLFKTIWFLFIPIIPLFYIQLKKQHFTGFYSITLFIVIPIIVHFLLLSFLFLLLSFTFYGGRYDLYKILTYTLSNDLYILIIVYSIFVLGYRFLITRVSEQISVEEKHLPETLVINNGKVNSILRISEIVQIIAATPYITIQLENKKYLHTATLRSIYELLDQNDFIRIHKSAIVNIHKVDSYKSRLNGDHDLKLKNGQETRLSRTYAADFKKRFDPVQRVRQ